MSRSTALTTLLLVLAPLAGQKDASTALKPLLRTLDRTATKLATKGHRGEFGVLVRALRELGATEKSIASLEKRGERSLAKAKNRKPVASEAKSLRRLAEKIGNLLPGLPEARRPAAARAVLAIDGTVRAAHDALGHVEHGGRRVPPAMAKVLQRRAELREAFQKCRTMEFEFEEGESDLSPVRAVTGKNGHYVAWKTVALHSPTIPKVRLRRIFTDGLRAYAFHHFLMSGKIEPPPVQPTKLRLVLLGSHPEYLKCVTEALANKGLPQEYKDAAKEWNIYTDHRWYGRGKLLTGWYTMEVNFAAFVLRELYVYWYGFSLGDGKPEQVAPVLNKGHLHYVGRTFLGAEVPAWDVVDLAGLKKLRQPTGATIEETEERKRLARKAEVGMPGVRAYLRYLVRRDEDPKVSATILNRSGPLVGELLLKAISIVEYMHETGRFPAMFKQARDKPNTAETFTKLWGEDLGVLDDKWRAWLLAGDQDLGVVARLSRPTNKRATMPAALSHLNAIRKRAVPPLEDVAPPTLDLPLSASCGAHARYLLQNVKQQSEWPGCHEEYSDRPGYSPAGSWSGTHSVIDPGAKSGPNAVDRWMATFYHRVPLLHPGLVAIGWAMEKNVAVLDSGSLVDNGWETALAVAYPEPGARKVPRAFSPELPNPVPGEDQSKWGYPITLQMFGVREKPLGEITLELYRGAVKPSNRVPCHFSTPSKPTNPRLAPDRAWCLIPKAHLAAGQTYIVVAKGLPQDSAHLAGGAWKFKVGTK